MIEQWKQIAQDATERADVPRALRAYQKIYELEPAAENAVDLTYINWLDGRFDEALKMAKIAVELAPDVPEIGGWLSDHMSRNGDFSRHMLELGRHFEKVGASFQIGPDFPPWYGERDSVVYVLSDGGLGDFIQACRYLPKLEAEFNCIYFLDIYCYEYHQQLEGLLRKQPWLKVPRRGESAACTHWTTITGLQWIFTDCPERIAPNQTWVTDKADLKSDKPLVGICYKTPSIAVNGLIKRLRSLTDEQACKIVDGVPGVQWVSLQREECQLPECVWRPELKNWETTASIIAACDAVVTIDTSVAHLVGAMGKPGYMLLPGASDWKWFTKRTDCLWYPSIKLIRNTRYGLDEAVDKVIEELNGRKNESQDIREGIPEESDTGFAHDHQHRADATGS